MLEELGNDLKKVALASLGAVILAGEKVGELTEELVRKGEETVQKSKLANEELKRRNAPPMNKEEVAEQAAKLTPEERQELIAQLQDLDTEDTNEPNSDPIDESTDDTTIEV